MANKNANPSKYTQAIADEICTRIAQGESLRHICEDRHMPNKSAVFVWLRNKKDFVDQYVRARDDQADHYVDEVVEIVDTEKDAAKARVRMDARKWVAGKLKPKKYGDKMQHTGADGREPVKTSNIFVFNPVSSDD